MAHELAAVDINALTEGQFTELRHLTVSEHQEVLGKSFLDSIEDWENACEGQDLSRTAANPQSLIGKALALRSRSYFLLQQHAVFPQDRLRAAILRRAASPREPSQRGVSHGPKPLFSQQSLCCRAAHQTGLSLHLLDFGGG